MTDNTNLRRTAVIIVDMQELSFSEMLKGKTNELVQERETLTAQIIHLIAYARTRGWHVFFTKEEFTPGFHDAPKYAQATKDPRYLASYPKNQLVSELIPYIGNGEIIVKKRHSAFDGTGLRERMEAIGIDDLLLAGVNTDACITATAYGARQDFDVHIVSDCVGSPNKTRHDMAIMLLNMKMASVRSLAEIQAAEQSPRPANRRQPFAPFETPGTP